MRQKRNFKQIDWRQYMGRRSGKDEPHVVSAGPRPSGLDGTKRLAAILDAKPTKRPSDILKVAAKAAAVARGHLMSRWSANPNGSFTARCKQCFAVATVIPRELPRDGRGFGGKAITTDCGGAA